MSITVGYDTDRIWVSANICTSLTGITCSNKLESMTSNLTKGNLVAVVSIWNVCMCMAVDRPLGLTLSQKLDMRHFGTPCKIKMFQGHF